MAERQTIEMGDREMFAAMAMQALITREGWRADVVAKQAVSSKTEVHFSATPLIVRPGTGATVLARLRVGERRDP